ncbi:MAG TPA: signal peptidase II [Steroidobacteraceae bacterium]|nr:signal peptidase II [Steroidobacteraceae bacterium]
MRALSRSLLVALVLVGCVGCDQISKAAARAYLPGSGVHSFLGDTLRLQYAQNPGAFLSLGESLPPAVRFDGFTVAVGAIVVALLGWALLSQRLSWPTRLAITAIGAGGLGNVIDRLRFDGAVTDFLNLGIGSLRTGIFNIADAILMVGVIALLIGWSRKRED